MSNLQRANPIFATGSFLTFNPGEVPIGTPLFQVIVQGTPNWTGARAGTGGAILTWGSGEAIDALEATVFLTPLSPVTAATVAAQTDLTLTTSLTNLAVPAAIDGGLAFLVLRVS